MTKKHKQSSRVQKPAETPSKAAKLAGFKSVEQLAQKVGVNRVYLYKVWNGERAGIRLCRDISKLVEENLRRSA